MRILTRFSPLHLLAAASVSFAADPAATPAAKPAATPAPAAAATPAAAHKPAATPPKPPTANAPKPAAAPAKPVAQAKPAATPKPPRKAEDAVTPVVKDERRHQGFLERIKQGDIDLLFLGDSITDGWNKNGERSWLKFAPYKPANLGVSGERTEQLLWRLTNGELDGINPKLIVLMIGTNNIGQMTDEKSEWAAAGVKKILDTIHEKLPKTKVLLLGVFPRNTADSTQRKQVGEINEIIKTYADGKTVRYLDIGKVFLDKDGEIPADVMPDKLHPNAHGYDLWYEAIKQPVAEMMKGGAEPAAKSGGTSKKKKK